MVTTLSSNSTGSPSCQSVNQEGESCVRKFRHKDIRHSNGKGGYWIGGSKKPAGKTVPKPPKREPLKSSEGSIYLSEADYQTWAKGSYFSQI
jgi:hypothetical protein